MKGSSLGNLPRRSQQEAEKLFKEYNARYFGSRLSGYRVVVSDRFNDGRCERKIKTIFLNPQSTIPLEPLLLHEMAHAATNGGHGDKWQSEMKRLIRRGAPVKEELAGYLRPARPIRSPQILQDFEDAGSEGVMWRDARLRIGYEYGLVDSTGKAQDHTQKLLEKAYGRWRKGHMSHKELKECAERFQIHRQC